MLKIGNVRWRGKCPRHPKFDPYMDGRSAIRGGCERCAALVDIHNHHVQMLALMRGFAPPQPARRRREKTPDPQASLFGDI
jgi:hypothetical protein